jgi:hypothetical protein
VNTIRLAMVDARNRTIVRCAVSFRVFRRDIQGKAESA